MKLPGTIHLGHRKLKISEISPKTASKESVYGDFDPAKDRIRIDRSLPHTKKLNKLSTNHNLKFLYNNTTSPINKIFKLSIRKRIWI